MKIVVTGGAGFIGSEMSRQLLDRGHQVAVLDSLTYASRVQSLESIMNEIRFTKLDIRDSVGIDRFFAAESFDAIINFAAETHVDNSILNPKIFAETNIIYLELL